MIKKYLFGVRGLIVVLLLLLAGLQYNLWLGKGGVLDIRALNQAMAEMDKKNTKLDARNQALQANIEDLKHGRDATEEQARAELGMVKPDETYYQILGDAGSGT